MFYKCLGSLTKLISLTPFKQAPFMGPIQTSLAERDNP